MASGDTKTEAMLNALGNGGSADEFRGCCNTKTQQYILDAIDRVQNVEDEVEELKNNPDVVDIVDTYADLQAYDKSTLTDKDIIRVLEDSTHNNKSTYYRYSASTDSFTYIGEAGGGVNVVQTTGTSTTDVMSQNAVTSMVFADAGTNSKIRIGNTNNIGTDSTSIGVGTNATGGYSVNLGNASKANAKATGLGYAAEATGGNSVALGFGSKAGGTNSISFPYSTTNTQGQVQFELIGSEVTQGYNNTKYRLISGVHDPVNAHDAATKGYVDAHAGGASVANLYINMNDLPTTVGSQTNDKNIYSDPELTQILTGLNVRNSLANNDLTIINIIDKVNGVYPVKTYATTSSIAPAEDIEAYSGMGFWIPASSIDGSLIDHGFFVYFEGPESGIFQFSLQ